MGKLCSSIAKSRKIERLCGIDDLRPRMRSRAIEETASGRLSTAVINNHQVEVAGPGLLEAGEERRQEVGAVERWNAQGGCARSVAGLATVTEAHIAAGFHGFASRMRRM